MGIECQYSIKDEKWGRAIFCRLTMGTVSFKLVKGDYYELCERLKILLRCELTLPVMQGAFRKANFVYLIF